MHIRWSTPTVLACAATLAVGLNCSSESPGTPGHEDTTPVGQDGGVQQDGGSVHPDGGMVFVDGGMAPVDAGQDAGMEFVDAGVDGGMVVDDGGVPTLTLTILPSITSSPPGVITSAEGLNCALGASTTGTGTCVVSVARGAMVVLNATPPASAWAITGVDAACNPGPTCQVRVNHNAVVRPTFGIPP